MRDVSKHKRASESIYIAVTFDEVKKSNLDAHEHIPQGVRIGTIKTWIVGTTIKMRDINSNDSSDSKMMGVLVATVATVAKMAIRSICLLSVDLFDSTALDISRLNNRENWSDSFWYYAVPPPPHALGQS